MIVGIIELLNMTEHYGVSERVEIAKGKYEIARTWKQGINKIKRVWQTRKLKSK
jgi:hypothetical protein